MGIKRIEYSREFVKDFKKAPKKIQTAFRNRLELFVSNKFHPLLNNHSLGGSYEGYRSINVTGDWRVIFREFDGGETIYIDVLGTHSQLYK